MACARMNEHAPREMNQCTPHECTPYHKGPLPYTNLWSICMYSTIFKWRYRSLLKKIVCFIGLFSNQCTLRLRWRVHGWMRAHHVSADQLDEWVHIISLCDSSIYPFMTRLYVCNTHIFIFFDGYCSTVQGLLDWFEVDLGFTELSFICI